MNMNSIPKSSPVRVTAAGVGGECGNCDDKDIWVIHHVRLRGIYRRLCTSCVLRLHPASFCPSCFTFYDSTPPPPSKRLSCANCSSFTHAHCAPPHPPSPFLCPPCSTRPANNSFTFFRPLEIEKNNSAAATTSTTTTSSSRSIDRKMGAVLLCAASIASASMAKAVIVARAEAERRVREATLCRKRAREALEHVSFLVNRDKLLKKDAVESVEVSGSGNNNSVKVVDRVAVGSPNTPNTHHHHPLHQHHDHDDHDHENGNANGNENDDGGDHTLARSDDNDNGSDEGGDGKPEGNDIVEQENNS